MRVHILGRKCEQIFTAMAFFQALCRIKAYLEGTMDEQARPTTTEATQPDALSPSAGEADNGATAPVITLNKRYVILSEIGRGGMGVVYRAADRLTGQQIALKSVTKQSAQWQFNPAYGDKIDRHVALAQEFQFLASLRHPNIISVLDYGFDTNQMPYFTMDLLDDPLDILQACKDRPPGIQVDFLIQTLQALSYLHRRGILHRDLKPDNILITNGQVKVLDFGLSIRRDQETEVSGTLAYMAPELLRGEPPTVSSDLYSVGIIAYELLTGRHPFDKEEFTRLLAQIVHDTPDFSVLYQDPTKTFILPRNMQVLDPAEVMPLPPEAAGQAMAPIIERLLEKRPEKRFNSANEVIDAITRGVSHEVPIETEAIRESFLQAAQFVGRDRELYLLINAMQAAMQERGSVWLVGGESGVGKTRLLEELRIRALVQGVQVLRGQGVAEGGQPYDFWRPIVQRLMILTPPTPFEASVLQTIFPGINALVDFEIPPVPPLDDQQARQRILSVITALFRRQTTTLVVMLEDLQWARESMILFKHLAVLVPNLPVLLIGSYRDDERPTLPSELPNANLMKLDRLDRDSVARLSASILGAVGMKPDVVELLHQTSEGNVFFLVEVVRTLATVAGQLEKIGEMPLPEHVFAKSAVQIVERRLRYLSPKDSHFLRAAAVGGRQLDLAVLSATLPGEDIEKFVAAAADSGFLAVQEQTWQFSHDQVRNALLEKLEPAERIELHGRVAKAVEQVYEQNLSDYAGYLVHHWHMAGDVEREGHYSIMLGEYLFRIGSYGIAMENFRRALEIATERNTQPELALLNCRIGELHWRVGEYFQASSRLKTSLRIAQELNHRKLMAEALLNMGIVSMRIGQLEEAADSLRQSLSLSRELGESVGVARTLNSLGTISRRLGKYNEAEGYLLESLGVARTNDDLLGAAYALDNLGMLLTLTGGYDQAEAVLSESLQILRPLQDRAGIGAVLISLGMVALPRGDYEKAQEFFRESYNLCNEIGIQEGVANAVALNALIALYQNQLDDAKAFFGESAFIYRTLGDWGGIAASLLYLGLIDLQTGNHSSAQVQLEESLRIYRRLSDQADMSRALTYLAMLELARQAPEKAVVHLKEAIQIAYQIGATPILFESALQLGHWYRATGNIEAAAEIYTLVATQLATAQHVRASGAEALAQLAPSSMPETTRPSADIMTVIERFLKS